MSAAGTTSVTLFHTFGASRRAAAAKLSSVRRCGGVHIRLRLTSLKALSPLFTSTYTGIR